MGSPVFVPLKKSDYGQDGLGSRDALDKFFNQINGQNQQLQSTLTNGIDFSNLNGAEFEFDITTSKLPTTDWIDITLGANFVAYGAGGWVNPSYRFNGNRLEMRGLFKNLTAVGANFWVFPTTVTATTPHIASQLAPVGSTAGAGRLFAIPCGVNGVTNAMVRWDVYSTGMYYNGTVFQQAPPAVATIDYGPLDAISWDVPAYMPLSCFPITVRIDDGKTPKGVFLTSVIDKDQSGAVGIAPGAPSWTVNQGKTGFPNSFSIKNIPGLAMGRTYHVTGVVLFK